jgi:hypothetical protein
MLAVILPLVEFLAALIEFFCKNRHNRSNLGQPSNKFMVKVLSIRFRWKNEILNYMKPHSFVVSVVLLLSYNSFAQATFQSIGSGSWMDTSVWTKTAGTSTTNYPVSGDTVTIKTANTITIDGIFQCYKLSLTGGSVVLNSVGSILTVTNSLSVTSASNISLNQGFLTVIGNMSVGGGSTVTVNQGALSVLGFLQLNSPTSAGTTLLDVQGGAFSCVGGMTVLASTVPAGRFAELRIGNSLVNVVGGLVTISANGKINFTGAGTLTLAGVISFTPGSFTAGNGRVVYVGIPNTNQAIATAIYNRLVITGLGTGVKTVNSSVTVTDSLTLLTDTLVINASGSLKLNNGSTIVRTAGILTSTPTFLGTVNVVYNNVSKDTTGPELPVAPSVLQNLTINNISGVKLGASVTVNNNLNLQLGALITDIYTLTIANPNGGASSDPGVTQTNGYVVGSINRNIGTTSGIRFFPFGTENLISNNRSFTLNYTAPPTSAGQLKVQHFNSAAASQSGLPLPDGGINIVNTAPVYWQADALGGLAGGTYTLSLNGQGVANINDVTGLRIIKRPSSGGAWTLNGTAGVNSGTNAFPTVVRQGMSGFSQFTFGGDNVNPLPINIRYFSGKVYENTVMLNWQAANESEDVYFIIERSKNVENFKEIGSISHKTDGQNKYTFTDLNAENGINYYRLKQVNFNNKYLYSHIISLKTETSDPIRVFPSPGQVSVTIECDNNLELKLYNQLGQYIQSMSVGNNDISSLPGGLYYIKTRESAVRFVKN